MNKDSIKKPKIKDYILLGGGVLILFFALYLMLSVSFHLDEQRIANMEFRYCQPLLDHANFSFKIKYCGVASSLWYNSNNRKMCVIERHLVSDIPNTTRVVEETYYWG